VRDLYEKITGIIMKKVARNSYTLSLPIEPHTEIAVVDIIVLYDSIYSGVELYSRHLVPPEFLLLIYIVDMIMLYPTKAAAHMPHYTRLTAIVDNVVAHSM
jgi:hypothetical protein